MDYPEERLHHEEPITFHKFWMMDPVREYQLWLQDHSSHSDSHDEL